MMIKKLFATAALLLLLTAHPCAAAITFFGGASSPADNGTQTDGAARSITPPASMQANDYVLVLMTTAHATATAQVHSNSTTGGQTWTKETQCVSPDLGGSTVRSTIFHARFNGTWDADPAFSTTNSSGEGLTLVMAVFRGVDTSTAFDVSPTCAGFDAPGGTGDVTLTALTTSGANSLAIAFWSSITAHTWTVQTGGWTQSDPAQFRNLSGSDFSSSYAYKIQATAGSTGDVTNRESGDFAGTGWKMALKESGPSVRRQFIIIKTE